MLINKQLIPYKNYWVEVTTFGHWVDLIVTRLSLPTFLLGIKSFSTLLPNHDIYDYFSNWYNTFLYYLLYTVSTLTISEDQVNIMSKSYLKLILNVKRK